MGETPLVGAKFLWSSTAHPPLYCTYLVQVWGLTALSRLLVALCNDQRLSPHWAFSTMFTIPDIDFFGLSPILDINILTSSVDKTRTFFLYPSWISGPVPTTNTERSIISFLFKQLTWFNQRCPPNYEWHPNCVCGIKFYTTDNPPDQIWSNYFKRCGRR